MSFTYEFERPSVTVDLVAIHEKSGLVIPKVLLVRRKKDPFAGRWALPGGFLNQDEQAEKAAYRECEEETGLRPDGVPRLVGVYSNPSRDPRGRVISLAYSVILRGDLPPVDGRDDAAEARWFPIIGSPETFDLAFDHDEILEDALGIHPFWRDVRRIAKAESHA